MIFETGVPIPRPKPGGRPQTAHGMSIHKMGIGDSVLCDSPAECNAARRMIFALGGKPTSRKLANGWRVWRVE